MFCGEGQEKTGQDQSGWTGLFDSNRISFSKYRYGYGFSFVSMVDSRDVYAVYLKCDARLVNIAY